MRKSLQFALAAGSMFIFSSAAMAQDATLGRVLIKRGMSAFGAKADVRSSARNFAF